MYPVLVYPVLRSLELERCASAGFEFPLGNILVGRSRDLATAHNSFALTEPRWKMSTAPRADETNIGQP